MTTLDLCANEPIRVPGAVQPHGALVCVSPSDGRILNYSMNASAVLEAELSLGAAMPLVVPNSGILRFGGRKLQVTTHHMAQGVLLEFEPLQDEDDQTEDRAYEMLRKFMERIESASDIVSVGQAAAERIRAMTGFNRTMIYRFDHDWNGTVIAEDGDGVLPSYLGLRFPASDIPSQARALYERNRLRLIPDADYQPVPIYPLLSPIDGLPIDLSPVSLRSVSPIHLQYMRNMATQASMSISLVSEGRLWGLIACHHRAARWVSPTVRSACDFLGQLVAQQLSLRERMTQADRRMGLKRTETKLLVNLARAERFESGMGSDPQAWLALTEATGAAVVFGDEVHLAGVTPSPAKIRELAAWLHEEVPQPIYATNSLSSAWAPGQDITAQASGLLAASLSQLHANYAMWFRRELVHTVTWAGDPRKAEGPTTLTPRTSFNQWKELVRGKADPWRKVEIETVADFRVAMIDFVLRHAEERAAMSEKLQLTNKELEAFSYSVSHDLRAPFRHIVGYSELLRDRETSLDPTSQRFLDTIRDAALSAGQLVDDLLAFSQLNRTSLTMGRVDMNKLVTEARTAAMYGQRDRQIDWRIGDLPEAWGDPTMIRQAVLNLLSNAVKFTGRRADASVTVEGVKSDSEAVYTVRDNGIGFDMRYVGKLFGVFQRLHRIEDFEGTGIGLALTKRVIDRHGGWIKAESVESQGATFTFSLPTRPLESKLA